MKIRLDRIRSEPFAWQETLELAPASLGRSELVALSPIACEGSLAPTDGGFLLRLTLAYDQSVTCSRCLKPGNEAQRTELAALVERVGEGKDAGELELGEADFGSIRVVGDELDTEGIVAEQIQLDLPVHPLCRADCQGLCPECGVDRNVEPCRCKKQEPDPRWAALGELRNRLPESR